MGAYIDMHPQYISVQKDPTLYIIDKAPRVKRRKGGSLTRRCQCSFGMNITRSCERAQVRWGYDPLAGSAPAGINNKCVKGCGHLEANIR